MQEVACRPSNKEEGCFGNRNPQLLNHQFLFIKKYSWFEQEAFLY